MENTIDKQNNEGIAPQNFGISSEPLKESGEETVAKESIFEEVLREAEESEGENAENLEETTTENTDTDTNATPEDTAADNNADGEEALENANTEKNTESEEIHLDINATATKRPLDKDENNTEKTEEAPMTNPEKTTVKNKAKQILTTEKMVGIGIFSALAFVASLFVRFPVQFLTFDAKDAVITIAAFVYGPLSAAIISLIVAFIEMITVSTTMWYGFLMNFASSAIFSVTASLIYRKKRNLNGAIIALYSAIAATVSVMLLLNIFITPLYFGMPVADPYVMDMLPTLLLPFNFAKALMNSAIVMLIYKPVVTALKRLGLVKTQGGSSAMTFNRTTKIILALGAVGLILSIAIFLILVL